MSAAATSSHGAGSGTQVSLFPMPAPPAADASSDRYDPVDKEEAAVLGRAVLAQLRGEALSDTQRAALARAGSPHQRAPEPVVDESETLLTLPRGGGGELRVSFRRYRGSTPFLDVRRWEKDRSGGLAPTKDGVVIRLRELPALLGAVRDAMRRAKRGDDA